MMKKTLNNMKFESPASSLLQYLSAALSIKKELNPIYIRPKTLM